MGNELNGAQERGHGLASEYQLAAVRAGILAMADSGDVTIGHDTPPHDRGDGEDSFVGLSPYDTPPEGSQALELVAAPVKEGPVGADVMAKRLQEGRFVSGGSVASVS